MEVNQEGNKDKKEIQYLQDVNTLNDFLRDPEILSSVLSTPIFKKHLQETHQGGYDTSVIQKEEIDQGPPFIIDGDDDGIHTLNELLARTPEVSRMILSTPIVQQRLSSPLISPQRPSFTPPSVHPQAKLVMSAPAPSNKNLHSLNAFLGRMSLTSLTSHAMSDYPISYDATPIKFSESCSPESSSKATPKGSVSTPIDYPIIASTTSTPALISVSDDVGEDEQDKRWNVEAELANLFNEVLKSCYPQLEDEKCTIVPCPEGFAFDYICEDVLTIWPKLRRNDRGGGPRKVGTKIMERIRLMRPEMLEQELGLHDVGFLSIKLSGLWIAKSVHNMLKDGINTWAPEFLMESVLVKFLPDNTDLMPIDVLRHELITRTLINMLEYSKIPVKFLMPPDEHPIEERDDGVLIFRDAEELEIHVKRDGCCGNLVNDLTELWYGLERELADWIVWVAPVHQQEYIKRCIKAAQNENWLPPHWSDSPRANFAGYQTYKSELKHELLDRLLSNAEVSCAQAAADLGYTGEQVSNCALKYTILKNDRLADYTFSYQERRCFMQRVTHLYTYLIHEIEFVYLPRILVKPSMS